MGTLIQTVNNTRSIQRPIHSHAVQVNELTLPLIALSGQEVFIVFDLVCQLRVQIELCGKLRYPVPGRKNKGREREGGERDGIHWKDWAVVNS